MDWVIIRNSHKSVFSIYFTTTFRCETGLWGLAVCTEWPPRPQPALPPCPFLPPQWLCSGTMMPSCPISSSSAFSANQPLDFSFDQLRMCQPKLWVWSFAWLWGYHEAHLGAQQKLCHGLDPAFIFSKLTHHLGQCFPHWEVHFF